MLCLFLVLVLIGQLTMSGGTNGGAETTTDSSSDSPPASSPEVAAEPEPLPDTPLARRDPDDPMAIGAVDAPLVMVEWTDIRCPFCAAFHRETLPVIVQEYVDAGLVRLEVQDVSFFGEQSQAGAIAARAAGRQGLFFEYTQLIYAEAPQSGHPDLTREVLIDYARRIGVADMDQFAADLDDPALRADVTASTATAQRLGVTSVPFFVVGDTVLAGAQPLENFRSFLDAALARVP